MDTNVVVSGIVGADPTSPPARILDAMADGRLVYLMSGSLFAEYSEVLCRPAIARLHRLADDEVDRLLTVLAANAMWREPGTTASAPDAGDNHLWALLASWPESRLITGDRRLLDDPPGPGAVLTPCEVSGLFESN
ncbi:MAG: putative toxin-antitoxin system toxin component, PIN family [Gemmatimonadota bacterium]|nr:putative toxin-antitoxin system toxin component, PIN family [Gemmatimonadota bacterium]MDE2870449.1 putative toxin-antitoxin system toxin component, PIN family [Gemmatimonadota bacterium]